MTIQKKEIYYEAAVEGEEEGVLSFSLVSLGK